MRLCGATLVNGSSKQPDRVHGHSGICGEKRICSQHPSGLGHLSVELVFPDSSGGAMWHSAPVFAGRGDFLPLRHESSSATGKEEAEKLD